MSVGGFAIKFLLNLIDKYVSLLCVKITVCLFICVCGPRLRDSVRQLAVPGGPPRPSAQPGRSVCGLRGLAVGHGRGAGGQPLPHVAGQEEVCHR